MATMQRAHPLPPGTIIENYKREYAIILEHVSHNSLTFDTIVNHYQIFMIGAYRDKVHQWFYEFNAHLFKVVE